MFIRIYNTLISILYPLVIKRYIKKRQERGKEDVKRFNERVGRPLLKRPEGRFIWFHGASVGESLSMLPLINKLLEAYPDMHIMVTTGTTTSAELMSKRLPERAFHQYLPIDNPFFTTRFVRHWHPDFKRWQQFDFISKELLSCFTFCLGQSEEDAYRLRVLGAKDSMCLGNIKFAGLPIPIDAQKKAEIVGQIGKRPVWCVSSTHEDEEFKIGRFLKKLGQTVPGLLTIIAPRHPNRGADIKQKLEESYGLKVSLRSAGEKITPETEVYVADTIGETGLWYDLCPLVFVGGSLIPHGGQNFMEPSRMRDAAIVGPHMHNFTEAMNRAKKADAVIQVNDVLELEETVTSLLTNRELLEAKRSLAYNWANSEAKVLDGILEKVKGYIE